MSYLDLLRGKEKPGKQPNRFFSAGCGVFGWVIFAVVVVITVIVAYRVFGYVRRIRSGELVDLPQFQAEQTVAKAPLAGTRALADTQELITPDSAAYGADAATAKLTIVEFGDFGCPYSQQVAAPLRTLMEAHQDQVRLIYRHYPIVSLHPDSEQAAEASECAGEQGQFWAMYDKLYQNQHAQKFNDLMRYAQELNLNGKQFQDCLTSGKYRDRIDRDLREAEVLGLSGTPSFYFNDQLVAGAIPTDVLNNLVDRLLENKN